MIKLTYLIGLLCICIMPKAIGQVEVFTGQIPLDSVFNSAYDEVNIVFTPDREKLFFTRANHPDNVGGVKDIGDVWASEKTSDGAWGMPYNVKSINSSDENQVIGFLDGGKKILVLDRFEFATFDKTRSKWGKRKTFKIPYLKRQSDHISASISSDGNVMLFGMESFGTYGVEDIFVSIKEDGIWSSPKNLGRVVNTSFQEITPFLAADNKTLIFASNGHGGEGSYDIFMTTRLDDSWQNWTTPVNMGNMANTPGRESSFVFNVSDEFAYLISTQSSEGFGDIKRVKIKPNIGLTEPIVVAEPDDPIENEEVSEDSIVIEPQVSEVKLATLTGSVKDNLTKKTIIGAEVILVSEDGSMEFKALTNSDGQFTVNASVEYDYILKVKAYQYFSYEEELNQSSLVNAGTQFYSLEPVVEGNTVALDHVLFEQSKAVLLEGSEKELDLVVEMMKYNPDISIFLSGHTDNSGKASLNIKLSRDRVETVKQYLIAKGISDDRISGKGFGGTKPRASNANVESRKLNRRVEFTVHKKK